VVIHTAVYICELKDCQSKSHSWVYCHVTQLDQYWHCRTITRKQLRVLAMSLMSLDSH